MLKITILLNNIVDDTLIKSGISKAVLLCQNIGFSLEINYKITNVVLTSNPLNTDVVHGGYGVNFQPILDSVDGSEDVACIIYNADNINPKPTNPNQFGVKKGNCTPIQIPEFWFGNFPDVLTQFFLHELCHAIYFLVGQSANDLTHNFYRSNYSQKQPTDYYLYLIMTLEGSWRAYKDATAFLTRGGDNGVETLGTLQIGQNFACKTLEKSWLNNQRNISCIPPGTYQVKWTFSWRMLKYTYEIQNVVGRSGIRFHSGNFFFDTDGCILLGDGYGDINRDGQRDIFNSRDTIKKFETLLNKQPFQLTIK